MRRLASCLMLVGLILCAARAGAVSFTPLGDLTGGSFESHANGVSADGSVVVGRGKPATGYEAFRWTSSGGMVGLGDLTDGSFFSHAHGVSANGSVVVGQGNSASGAEAFRWYAHSGLMFGLGDFTGGSFASNALDVSDDGSVIVGYGNSASGGEAFRWTISEGLVNLGDLPGGSSFGRAFGVSADGSVVVGESNSAFGGEAFRWTTGGGMVGLGDIPGGLFNSEAYDVSADGSVVVGQGSSASGQEAFRWTSGGGMVGLGDLPGGSFRSYGYGVSANGSVVVGESVGTSGDEAFLWTPVMGMVNLQDFLVGEIGIGNLIGWTLSDATAVSDSGRVIVGFGTNPSANTEAWRVSLESLDLQWTNTASGSWDSLTNWSYGLQPGAAGQDEILIQPDYGLTVTGPTSMTTVSSVTVDAQIAGTAKLTIQDTGLLIVTGRTTIGPRGKLTGNGTLVATGGTDGIGIDNDGEIDLGDGNLQIVGGMLINNGLIRGDGQIDNALNNAASGELRVQSGQRLLLSGSTNTNAGTINVGAGTVEFTAVGTLVNTGEISLTGGSFKAQGVTNSGEINLAGGSFRTSSSITNETAGSISGRGELHIESADSTLTNRGTLQFSGGFTDIHGNVNNEHNEIDGKIIVFGGATLTFYDDLVHNGDLLMGTGCSTVVFGTMSGTGTVSGSGTLYIEGTIAPGNSPGEVALGGDLVMGGSADLEIELGGLLAGQQHDLLDVDGLASLDGTLEVKLIDGFTPSLGESFTVMTFDSREGDFDEYLGMDLAEGLWLQPDFTSDGLVLVAVPEPSTLLMLVAGVLASAALIRRR